MQEKIFEWSFGLYAKFKIEINQNKILRWKWKLKFQLKLFLKPCCVLFGFDGNWDCGSCRGGGGCWDSYCSDCWFWAIGDVSSGSMERAWFNTNLKFEWTKIRKKIVQFFLHTYPWPLGDELANCCWEFGLTRRKPENIHNFNRLHDFVIFVISN